MEEFLNPRHVGSQQTTMWRRPDGVKVRVALRSGGSRRPLRFASARGRRKNDHQHREHAALGLERVVAEADGREGDDDEVERVVELQRRPRPLFNVVEEGGLACALSRATGRCRST